MKKIKFFAYAGAIALLSTGFVACSSTESEVADNPNYNPETGEVLTSFVMNVNTATSPITRMTSANTQANSGDPFRGITDAHLLSFKRSATQPDGSHIHNAVTGDKHYSLGNVYSTSQATTNGSKSHRVLELALPTETNALVFYGKAPKTAANGDGFTQGNIDYLPEYDAANPTDLSKYSFKVKQVVETNASGYNQTFRNYGDLLTNALNWVLASKIENADVQYDTNGDGVIKDGDEHFPTTLSWFQFVKISGSVAGGNLTVEAETRAPADGTPMCAIGEILGQTLAEICTLNQGELRAGSGPAVARMLGDVWVIMDNVGKTAPTSLYEAKAQAMAKKIKENITALTDGTAPSLTWKEYSAVASAICGGNSSNYSTLYPGQYLDGIGGAGGKTALQAFPIEKFNLPPGCTQIAISEAVASSETDDGTTYTKTAGSIKFHHVSEVSMFSPAAGSTSCYSVYYPAELCYWGNSPIRVTDETVTEAEYPQGVTNWLANGSWTSKNWVANKHVVSTTRSVAMQYNINYGNALLKTRVKYGTTDLKDNNHAIQLAKNPTLADSDEPDATITVGDGTFTLKGILVGGMATKVGYDFLPASDEFKSAIYDKSLTSEEIPTSGYSEPNYTLVWDNWNVANKGKKQNPVYVCLEFQNNSGKDFWGMHNIIRNEGVFYIIGKLDPNAGITFADEANPTAAELAQGINWPDAGTACLPPHDDSGNTLKERRVFIEDFMTDATFVIGEKSLQHAYVTVPDLRSTQISLGLSVDLQWQSGMTFNDVILGE